MKKFLHLFLVLTMVGFSVMSYGQGATGSCSITDLLVQNIRPIGPGSCTFTFDLSFSISSNSSKYVYFQSYIQRSETDTDYPDYFDCQNGTTTQNGTVDPPTLADLGGEVPFLNVIIDNRGTNPVLLTTYPPDPLDPTGLPIVGVVTGTQVLKFDLPDGNTRFNILGLQVVVPGDLCTAGDVTPFLIVSDFFGTNANNPNVIQCVSCEVPFAAAFFSAATSLVNCSSGALQVTLTSNIAQPIAGTFALYADVNDNNLYTPGIDVLIDVPSINPDQFQLTGDGDQFTIATTVPQNLLGYNILFVSQITSTGFGQGASQATILITCGSGAALPVKFKSFNANRKNTDVLLTWETASEDNNKGFYVQRNTGNGWKDLGFVASKGADGNSSSVLGYAFTDLNNTNRGVTQYRIMQVDIDGKAKLSEVRLVRGLDQAGRAIVYPNPSSDGKVNVVFEESKSTWDVFVSDMNGRMIRQFRGVTNNILVDNLVPGMYMIRLVDLQSGKHTNEKVIVNGR